jgi:hypothetical protein
MDMDLSDFGALGAPTPAGPPAAAPLDPRALVAQLGSEVASTLSAALERVIALSATGRIDQGSLRALREEIDLARRAGIMGQQVVRLGNGRVPQAHERLDLTALLREAMRQRAREIEVRGIEVRQLFAPAEVKSDATLLFSLLQTTLDWSFEHAASRIDLTLEVKSWPAHARLTSRYAHCPPDEVDSATASLQVGEEAALNTMSWRLLQQTAAVLGLLLQRRDTPGRTELTIEFPTTLAPHVPGRGATAEPVSGGQGRDSQPLAGRHVLVLAPRREVRNLVREALRPMGLMLDFVSSIDEAQDMGRDGIPHALVYEAGMGGERFERLRGEWLAAAPHLALIQIDEQGKAFQVLNVGGRQFTSIGRDAIIESLPAALSFELARNE